MGKFDSTIPGHMLDGGDALLQGVIAERLGDSELVPVVTAVAVLLGRVAYADRQFAAPERERIRAELRSLAAFSGEDAEVVLDVLSTHIEEIGAGPTAAHCLVLRERLDRGTRMTMLRLLVDLAIVDGHLFKLETGLLERISAELELDPAESDALIERARDSVHPPPLP